MRPSNTALTALCFALAVGVAEADPCGMVPPIWEGQGPAITRIGEQLTYVFYKDGIESFVIRPSFEGKVDEFGMLIPFPSPPAIRKLPDDVFEHEAQELTFGFRGFDGAEFEHPVEERIERLGTREFGPLDEQAAFRRRDALVENALEAFELGRIDGERRRREPRRRGIAPVPERGEGGTDALRQDAGAQGVGLGEEQLGGGSAGVVHGRRDAGAERSCSTNRTAAVLFSASRPRLTSPRSTATSCRQASMGRISSPWTSVRR